jgi:hypothetical protein
MKVKTKLKAGPIPRRRFHVVDHHAEPGAVPSGIWSATDLGLLRITVTSPRTMSCPPTCSSPPRASVVS